MKLAEEKRIYTVSDITRDIRLLLEDNLSGVWVVGEVTGFIHHQSGHMYFSIKDEGSILSCTLFRGVNSRLKFEIKNGMQILCFGKITAYDKRGQYQMNIRSVEPKGAGALQIAFEQLKEKLIKEGLFDEAHKKPIPYLPKRIGIVTSPTGAAIRDMLNVLERRFSNIEIILNPVRVQGEFAKEEIRGALDLFNTLKNVDVIIVGRGGGSLEDLWPFNEEIVARAIYRSEIPIISAVGHEVDYTISDFVSDLRALTPTEAAVRVVPDKDDLIADLKELKERMRLALISKKDFLNEKLKTLKGRRIFKDPTDIVTRREQEIDDLGEDLALKGRFAVKLKGEALSALIGKLDALSPLGILGRGYSITMEKVNGKIVKNAGFLNKKDLIKTKLDKGEIVSRVEEIWQR